jgi:hypothetical protein
MADPTDQVTPPPGYINTPAMSPLTVDGLPLANISGAIATQSAPGQQTADSQRFWASQPRPLTSAWDETIEIHLAKPTKVNYIALDLPHFPHHFYIFYWEPTKKEWLEIQAVQNKLSVRFYIDGSVPSVIGPATVLQAHQHPSHYGSGHWVHYEADLTPFTATKFRMTGNRGFGSTKGGPVDVYGKQAAYSLGIRNFDFGTRVVKKVDIPLTNRDPDIITERESFTTVTDILGSPVELSIRENRASDLMNGRMWKCEPQPFSYAVVPLYVDSRDSNGAPQVIDRFYLEPITSGVSMNLYYSETPPDVSDFEASDAPMTFPMSRSAGEMNPLMGEEGLLFPNHISYVDIDNQAVQWNPQQPFWVALEIQPQFSSSESTEDHLLLDIGAYQLMWLAGAQSWAVSAADTAMTLPSFDFDMNERLQIALSYDGERVTFYMPQAGAVSIPANLAGLTVSALRFGAELGDSAEELIITGAYRLGSFVLKAEALDFVSGESGLIVPDAIQEFIENPQTYVQKPPYEGDDSHTTRNSLLRFATNFALGTGADGLNPWGFVGGPGDIYDDVVWTPVNRDFKLQKGFMQINPTRASCWKFEFTNLQAQPYAVFKPTTTKVQVFPSAIVAQSAPATPSGDTNVTSSGLQVNFDQNHPLTYADAVRLLYTQPTASSMATWSPTEALVAQDPATAARLQQFGGLYNFHPWQPPATCPRFPTTASHYYETIDVVQNSKIAYFVALASLRMYRVDYTTSDDTDIYLESFGDINHINDGQLVPQNVQTTINRAANPSFELDANTDGMPDTYTVVNQGSVTSGFAGGPLVSQSSDTALHGSYSLKVDGILGATGTDRLGASFLPTGLDMANSLAASVYACVTQGSPLLRLTVEYYTSGNAFISSSNATATSVGTNWQRISGTFTPPPTSDHVKVYVWAEAGGGPITAYFDAIQVEEGSVSDYIDGDQPGGVWLGSANNSASQRTGITTSPWVWKPGELSTPPNLSDPAVALSKPMISQRKVRGIQFATQQSAATQLLIDPDFDDPELRSWTALGDIAPMELSEDFNATVGSTVKIARLSGLDIWDATEAAFPSWDVIEASNPDPFLPNWNDMEGSDGTANYGGIRYTATVETTKAGRIYAAARVYSDVPLNEPLILQIIDEDGSVLAETEQDISGGHISEWYTSFTIGDVDMTLVQSWNDIENSNASPTLPSYNDLEIQTWDTVDLAVQPLGVRVSAQVIQRGSTDDVWFLDNLSLFEDSIVWEFSNDGGATWWPVYDIRNDPKGVFIFPDPTSPTPSTGTQLMWRVSGYRPNVHVSSLAIRPWYGSLPFGVPHREPGMGGPNVQPTDHFPPVEQDPRWMGWHEPIPQDWWFRYRQLLALQHPYIPVDTSTPSSRADVWIHPHALVPLEPVAPPVDTGGGSPDAPEGPEVFVDMYSIGYPDTYGPEAGGDTFTDEFGNNTY